MTKIALSVTRLNVVVVLAITLSVSVLPTTVRAQSDRNLDADDIDRLIQELSNWGRWGEKDELGTLNLITSEKKTPGRATSP